MHDFISKKSPKYPKYPNIVLFLLLLLGGGTIGVSNIRILEWKIINIALSVKYRQGRKMVNIRYSLWKLSISEIGSYAKKKWRISDYQFENRHISDIEMKNCKCRNIRNLLHPLSLLLFLFIFLLPSNWDISISHLVHQTFEVLGQSESHHQGESEQKIIPKNR